MVLRLARLSAFLLFVASLTAQQRATPQEFKQAELEAPQLAGVMDLKPGMTIADVGAGFGAMTVALSKWLGPAGHVYANDVTPSALAALRAEVEGAQADQRDGRRGDGTLRKICLTRAVMRCFWRTCTITSRNLTRLTRAYCAR
jgi:predicted methyltransferase